MIIDPAWDPCKAGGEHVGFHRPGINIGGGGGKNSCYVGGRSCFLGGVNASFGLNTLRITREHTRYCSNHKQIWYVNILLVEGYVVFGSIVGSDSHYICPPCNSCSVGGRSVGQKGSNHGFRRYHIKSDHGEYEETTPATQAGSSPAQPYSNAPPFITLWAKILGPLGLHSKCLNAPCIFAQSGTAHHYNTRVVR